MNKNDLTAQALRRTTTPKDTKNTILFCLFGKSIFIFPRTTAKGLSFLPNENSDIIILGSSGSGSVYSDWLEDTGVFVDSEEANTGACCLTASFSVISGIIARGGRTFTVLGTTASLNT